MRAKPALDDALRHLAAAASGESTTSSTHEPESRSGRGRSLAAEPGVTADGRPPMQAVGRRPGLPRARTARGPHGLPERAHRLLRTRTGSRIPRPPNGFARRLRPLFLRAAGAGRDSRRATVPSVAVAARGPRAEGRRRLLDRGRARGDDRRAPDRLERPGRDGAPARARHAPGTYQVTDLLRASTDSGLGTRSKPRSRRPEPALFRLRP